MLKRILISKRKFNKIIKFLCHRMEFLAVTYSQNCEDLIIDSILELDKGIYVDVGAHHPVNFSNTLQLYLKGWKGINIDPLPGCMESFQSYRPDDINLNVGISSNEGILKYYNFDIPAFNTTNEERANYVINKNYSKLVDVQEIRVITLKDVFEKHLEDKIIDLLTIDVETMELDVLKSNDWTKYRPRLIVLESIVSCFNPINMIEDDPSIKFLVENGYFVVAKVNNAVFLREKEELNAK